MSKGFRVLFTKCDDEKTVKSVILQAGEEHKMSKKVKKVAKGIKVVLQKCN